MTRVEFEKPRLISRSGFSTDYGLLATSFLFFLPPLHRTDTNRFVNSPAKSPLSFILTPIEFEKTPSKTRLASTCFRGPKPGWKIRYSSPSGRGRTPSPSGRRLGRGLRFRSRCRFGLRSASYQLPATGYFAIQFSKISQVPPTAAGWFGRVRPRLTPVLCPTLSLIPYPLFIIHCALHCALRARSFVLNSQSSMINCASRCYVFSHLEDG